MAAPLACYQRLAIAVLEKSLIDAWNQNARIRRDAQRFLRYDEPLLYLWCQAAQVAPRQVRRAAEKRPECRYPRPGNLIAGLEAEEDE